MIQTILGLGASLLAPTLVKNVQHQKVQVVHASKGRVRLQCNRWKNEQTARNLEKAFKQSPIVKSVQANPITGSLLLVFHLNSLTPKQFDTVVQKAVETSVATYPELQADLMEILKKIIVTIDTTMKKTSGGKVDVDSLLTVTLLVSGMMKLTVNPIFASSLFYWAYTIITRNKEVRR